MRITVKTLKNEKHSLEIEESDTVAQIKIRIHEQLNLGEPESQKLIHHGKILKDEQTAESAGFREDDFLVVMSRKIKKKKKKPTTESATAPTDDSTSAMNDSSATSATIDATSAAASPTEPTGFTSTAQSSLVTGPQYEESIANLMGMGFDHDQVVRALRAAYNNPDRAVEYLINGIPENVGPPPAAPTGMSQPSATSAPSGSSGGGAPQSGAADNSGLPNLGALFQQNPQLLTNLVANAARSNPQLMQQMRQNPQQFQQMLTNPEVINQLTGLVLLSQLAQHNQNNSGNGGGDAPATAPSSGGLFGAPASGPRPGTITINEEEKQSIDNLIGMGFDERRVIEAYLACDKNEAMAANFLLENQGNEQMDIDMGMGGPAAPASGGDAPADDAASGGGDSGGSGAPAPDSNGDAPNDDADVN